MGRQILFYMMGRDESLFVDYLRTTGDVVIIPQTSRGELQEEFRQFSDAEGRLLGEGLHLWNRSISPRPVVKHYPQQGYYWLDFLQSEVVNVMRSKLAESRLSMGRLHVEKRMRDAEGQTRQKSEQFEAWVSNLFRWLRNKSVRVLDKAYVLPEAHESINAGLEVTGHAF